MTFTLGLNCYVLPIRSEDERLKIRRKKKTIPKQQSVDSFVESQIFKAGDEDQRSPKRIRNINASNISQTQVSGISFDQTME